MTCIDTFFHVWGKWEDIETTAVVEREAVRQARMNNIQIDALSGDLMIKQSRRCLACNIVQLRASRTRQKDV